MLVYDDDYRIAQDIERFPWGTYSPYLRDVYLRGYATPTIASQQPKIVAKSNGLGKKHIQNHIQSPSVESTIGGGAVIMVGSAIIAMYVSLPGVGLITPYINMRPTSEV